MGESFQPLEMSVEESRCAAEHCGQNDPHDGNHDLPWIPLIEDPST